MNTVVDTYKHILDKLPTDGWYIRDGGLIRRKAERLPEYDQCPLACIAGPNVRSSEVYHDDVLPSLGLTYDQVLLFTDAADDRRGRLIEKEEFEALALRDELLEKLGLKETA